VESPANDDLLPTDVYLWDPVTQTYLKTVQRWPASVSSSVPLGAFQRAAQAAVLVERALLLQKSYRSTEINLNFDTFTDVDNDARALIGAMILQPCRYGQFAESFAICERWVYNTITSLGES
jgi:hypothetical protein